MTKAEGKKFNFEDISKINSEFLQTFEFESKDQYIKTETNEFSAVCPFSGLPDLARIRDAGRRWRRTIKCAIDIESWRRRRRESAGEAIELRFEQ